MDVLVCLASHAGQTVSRDALMEGVWPNQFVADTALARCVAELRQAFGDNAQTPVFIETIPKRGYRIVAPVDWLPAPQAAAAPAPAVASAPDPGPPLPP